MASSHYQYCMALQETLDTSQDTIGAKANYAKTFINATINPSFEPEIRLARADRAIQIADGLTLDSLVYPKREFGEVILKGLVSRVSCIRVDARLIITLPFFDSVVLGPTQDLESELLPYELEDVDALLPIDTHIARPFHVPVESLRYVKYAA